jgi:hypothetical protein
MNVVFFIPQLFPNYSALKNNSWGYRLPVENGKNWIGPGAGVLITRYCASFPFKRP